MHVIHIGSELAPIAKVGGLGDVLHGLSKELVRQGHHVEIILPKYDVIDYSHLRSLKVHYRDLWSFDGPHRYNNTIWSAEVDGLNVLLIEPHHPDCFFSRGTVYGCRDDIDRFLYFSRTAMEFLFKSGRKPDVLHVHDWPAAIVPVLYRDMYIPLGFVTKKTVLTLHNLEHQGRCSPHNLTRIGLHGEHYLDKTLLQDPASPQLINLLKGGIVYADKLTTVSPQYQQEIQTPEGGHGLDAVLHQEQLKLQGILNGIDEDFWNPETDPHLVARYSTYPPYLEEPFAKILHAKEKNKAHVRKHLRMTENKKPLVACITRLVQQKGPHLIAHALERTLERGGQFALLGSALDPEIHAFFTALQEKHSNNPDVSILLDYNEALAHQIFAGADLLVIPSIFEPCGLTQMIALRYGTIPLVRKTGGLADTIADSQNGFVFETPDQKGVNSAVDRALALWKNQPAEWQKIMKTGMAQDFSWKQAALEYATLYKALKT